MINTLLFDLDGTLIDSEHFHFECWNEILQDYNTQLTIEEWVAHYAGVPMPTNAYSLIKKFNLLVTHAELVQRRENLTIELLKTKEINLMPFALETLEYFADKGFTMALVTGSPRQDVEAIFAKNNLGRFFKLIITRSEVVNSKPHPESYELCINTLGIAKEECIVFEDTANGVKSAKAAGLVCYAIQSNSVEHHKLDLADKIFSDFNMAKLYLLETNQI